VFIVENILKNISCREKPPRILKQGTKILCLNFKKTKLIDSVSFIPLPLASFPKTFNISEISKGFFPFKFNIEKNQNYIGPIPEKEDFGYQFMNTDKKNEFDIFYSENKEKLFDFQNEFRRYCISDCELLTRGCLEFRKIIMNLTSVDPFRKNITIASLCHFIFRNFLLDPDEIALIPDNGYNRNQITSQAAESWLKFLIYSRKIQIKHAKNGGEKIFEGMRMDGWDEQNLKIYEFHG